MTGSVTPMIMGFKFANELTKLCDRTFTQFWNFSVKYTPVWPCGLHVYMERDGYPGTTTTTSTSTTTRYYLYLRARNSKDIEGFRQQVSFSVQYSVPRSLTCTCTCKSVLHVMTFLHARVRPFLKRGCLLPTNAQRRFLNCGSTLQLGVRRMATFLFY